MTRPKRASSTDVARLAGVSQSAVSRAFSPGAVVSALTREKVRAAAAELGYRPNALARSLITRRSNMVALMTGDIGNPQYARTIDSFSRTLQRHGLHALLFSLTDDIDVAAAVEEVLQYRVDGVILISAALSAQVAEACARVGVPVVLFNRYSRMPNASSVRIENMDGGCAIANLLLDDGHRRLGFIAGTSVDDTSGDREMGFTRRVGEHSDGAVTRADGHFTFDGGRAAFTELWRRPTRPTAIFAASDLMALGAMDAARHDHGLRVPHDVAIAGFDDLPAAAWPSYDLTTIRQPVETMATAAVELLLRRVADAGARPQTRLIPGELVIRGSTGPAAIFRR